MHYVGNSVPFGYKTETLTVIDIDNGLVVITTAFSISPQYCTSKYLGENQPGQFNGSGLYTNALPKLSSTVCRKVNPVCSEHYGAVPRGTIEDTNSPPTNNNNTVATRYKIKNHDILKTQTTLH